MRVLKDLSNERAIFAFFYFVIFVVFLDCTKSCIKYRSAHFHTTLVDFLVLYRNLSLSIFNVCHIMKVLNV